MGKRKEPRIKMVLPVRVWGMDSAGKPFSELAHTMNIAPAGALLAGFRCSLSLGDVVGIQYRHQKARFQVVWSGKLGASPECQIGVHCTEPNKELWGLQFLGSRDEYAEAPAEANAPRQLGRRTRSRYPVTGTAELRTDDGQGCEGKVTDIGMNGCYVENGFCFAVDTVVHTALLVRDARIEAKAVVRNSQAGFGMGLQFTELKSDQDITRLTAVIEALKSGVAAPPPKPVEAVEEGASLGDRLRAAGDQLRQIAESVQATGADPLLLREFRQALAHVRGVGWALQRWMELQSSGDSPKPVMKFLNIERIRVAGDICRSLNDDLETSDLRTHTADLQDLHKAVQELVRRLGKIDVKPEPLPAPAARPAKPAYDGKASEELVAAVAFASEAFDELHQLAGQPGSRWRRSDKTPFLQPGVAQGD